jgi:hypothetical protein
MSQQRRICANAITQSRPIVRLLSGVLYRFLVGLVGLRWNSNIANTVAQTVTLQFQFIQHFVRRYIDTFRKQLTQGITKLLDFHWLHLFTYGN